MALSSSSIRYIFRRRWNSLSITKSHCYAPESNEYKPQVESKNIPPFSFACREINNISITLLPWEKLSATNMQRMSVREGKKNPRKQDQRIESCTFKNLPGGWRDGTVVQACAAPAEDWCLILRTSQAAHNRLQFQLQRIWCSFMASEGTCTHMYIPPQTHIHAIENEIQS